MDERLVFKFYDIYTKNLRRLRFSFMPGARRKVKGNMKSAVNGIKRNLSQSEDIFIPLRDGLIEKLRDCGQDCFYDAKEVRRWYEVMERLNNRSTRKEEYRELQHNFRFREYLSKADIENYAKYLERELERRRG
ncbi:hypothetical protein K8R30_03100 [archaeon]|nr:hypothetical protein [archaeon]